MFPAGNVAGKKLKRHYKDMRTLFNHIKLQYIFILIITLTACDLKSRKDLFQDKIKEALESEKKEDYESGLKIIESAIKLDSQSSIAHDIRGRLKTYLNKNSEALEDFSIAISLDTSNTSAYYDKAKLFSSINKDDSAIIFFNLALGSKESGKIIYNYNPLVLSFLEKQKEIPMEWIIFDRGVSFYYLKQDSLATGDFLSSIRSGYKRDQAELNIGIIYLNNGYKIKGCDFLSRAVNDGNNEAEKLIEKYCK